MKRCPLISLLIPLSLLLTLSGCHSPPPSAPPATYTVQTFGTTHFTASSDEEALPPLQKAPEPGILDHLLGTGKSRDVNWLALLFSKSERDIEQERLREYTKKKERSVKHYMKQGLTRKQATKRAESDYKKRGRFRY